VRFLSNLGPSELVNGFEPTTDW